MHATVSDIREPTYDFSNHKAIGNWFCCSWNWFFVGSLWIPCREHQTNSKALLSISVSECLTWQAGLSWGEGMLCLQDDIPHSQPYFHAAPALFSQLCLAHAAPKDVPVLWASGHSDCACKTSHSASLCTCLCTQPVCRAGEVVVKESCGCSLRASCWQWLSCPGHPARGT